MEERESSGSLETKISNLTTALVIMIVIALIEGVILLKRPSAPKIDSDKLVSTNTNYIDNPITPTPTSIPAQRSGDISEKYKIPIRSSRGEELGSIDLLVKKYEFTKDVFINSQKATITNDKIVFAVDVELTNNNSFGANTISRDYFRLSNNGVDKWLAPDMHEDPIEIRPDSTVETRLGFTIDDSSENLWLKIGDSETTFEVIAIK